MATFLLRLEAVNFVPSCYDTNDLSTIRGGSMMLSNAHELIRSQLPNELHHEPVNYGASHALWEFTADDSSSANKVRNETLCALAKHELLKHATFVCAVLLKTDGGASDIQQLRMLNRWSQFQQPTVTAPDLPEDDVSLERTPYCEFDRVRPSAEMIYKGKDRYSVSASTKARRDYGKTQKQDFHQGLVKEEIALVNELSDLTSHPNPKHRLNGKMAVIFIDGNKQSEMAAEFGLADLGRFRTYVRDRHREFLTALLQNIVTTRPNAGESSEWFFWDREAKQPQHEIRLETLLWGGDDIVLVVPAWQGWSVVQKFYESAARWQFDDKKFTHSTGIVFCNEKAPIQRMREFADELVIQCKKKNSGGTYQDLIGYEVLESFDVPRADIERWWAARLRRSSGDQEFTDEENVAKTLLATPEQMAEIAEMVRLIREAVEDPKSEVSRRQIELLARSMPVRPMPHDEFKKDITTYLSVYQGFVQPELSELSARAKLFHLTALWDYIT
jgi:hypothetical protein